MLTQQAIDLAVKGGWHSGVQIIRCEENPSDADIVLDPFFWEGLGKTLGWTKYVWVSYPEYSFGHMCREYFTNNDEFSPPSESKYCTRYLTTEYYAHQLVDRIFSNKPESVFWDAVINNIHKYE